MTSLYELRDLSFKAVTPWLKTAEHWQKWLAGSHHLLADDALIRSTAGIAEIVERWTRPSQKPSWNALHITQRGSMRAIHEKVVCSKPFCLLKHFSIDGVSTQSRPKILVVAPLSGHYATLLKDTVTTLLTYHDVYITDWINARDVPSSRGCFDSDDYIDMLWDFLRHIGQRIHVLAVCQPTVQVLALTALMNQAQDPLRPRSIILMGGPLDTRKNPTQVNRFAQSHTLAWFERSMIYPVPDRYPGAGRLVYPGFLQLTGFVMLNPKRHIESHIKFLEDLSQNHQERAAAHRKFYDEYVAVMDMPAEYFLQTIRDVFQDYALPLGQLMWRGQNVNPRAIHDTAIMTIEGEHDDISGPGQTYAAHHLCSNLKSDMKNHYEQKDVGHYGLFSGHHWREDIAPRMMQFILQHEPSTYGPSKPTRARAKSAASKASRSSVVSPEPMP